MRHGSAFRGRCMVCRRVDESGECLRNEGGLGSIAPKNQVDKGKGASWVVLQAYQ